MTMDSELRTLRLDGLAFGGDAVGRDDEGRVLFVPGGAPRDRVEVRVTEAKKSWARGEIVRVLEPGQRVVPPCVYQRECGGCPWMHVEVAAQLEAKQEIVERALAKCGVEVERILPAPEWLGYRRRAKMTARAQAIGFAARRSHRIVDIDRCIALDPRLDAALQLSRGELKGMLSDGGTLSGLVAEDGRVHLTIDADGSQAPETLADAAASLVGRSGIVGVGVRVGDTRRFYGQPRLELDEKFIASAAGFAQANAAQNLLLRRLVLRWALPEAASGELPRLLELYAGDGNFTRDLVARARVVAVEGDPDGSARLLDNLRAIAPRIHRGAADAISRWSVRGEPSERAVRKLARAAERFDVVVLDPPRAGATECLESIAQLEPARVVYVSCDPMTLARDVARLQTLGYRGVKAQPIDMMPNTAHVEVVCLLERA
jgi:23S rRNA (uracil1939-C5)-methyltransferase